MTLTLETYTGIHDITALVNVPAVAADAHAHSDADATITNPTADSTPSDGIDNINSFLSQMTFVSAANGCGSNCENPNCNTQNDAVNFSGADFNRREAIVTEQQTNHQGDGNDAAIEVPDMKITIEKFGDFEDNNCFECGYPLRSDKKWQYKKGNQS